MSTERRGIPADVQRFFIPVELDRARVLAFDHKATFLVYQKYGANFWRELYERDPNAPEPEHSKSHAYRIRSVGALEYFLWAGLQKDAEAAGETLAIEDVRAMILPSTFSDLAGALMMALAATQRRPAKAESKNV